MVSQSTFYVEHPGLVAEHTDQSQPELTTSTETNHPINMPPRPSVQLSPFSSYPNSPDLFHNVDQGNKERSTEGEYRLLWKRSFPDPILGLDSVDITGDGLNEIIIMSLKGLHVLQVSLVFTDKPTGRLVTVGRNFLVHYTKDITKPQAPSAPFTLCMWYKCRKSWYSSDLPGTYFWILL